MRVLSSATRFPLGNGRWTPAIFAASFVGVVAAGIALGFIVSNILRIGPTTLSQAVTLTEKEGLPSVMAFGQEETLKFEIEASENVTAATLFFELVATGVSLGNPGIADVSYKHPGQSEQSVSLSATDGKLRGALVSPWDIPSGFDGTGEIKLTLKPGAPLATYHIDLWVDGTVGSSSGVTPTPTPTSGSGSGSTFTLDLQGSPNRFEWVSGTNADGTTPAVGDDNPPLSITAGETVSITFVGIVKDHRMSVYPEGQTCADGYCTADAIVSSSDISPGGQETITFSFPTAGSVLNLICDEHPGSMRTTITVQ